MRKPPPHYTEYYFINSYGKVEQDINDSTWWGRMHFLAGNYFDTKKEAEAVAKKIRKLLAESKNDRP